MNDTRQFLDEVSAGNLRYLPRLLSIVENGSIGSDTIEYYLSNTDTDLRRSSIAVTGAPGSGKSTLISKLVEVYTRENRKVGVIAIDPSSPTHGGALLGDRIRLMGFSTNPKVLIRSLASRGSIGGICESVPKIAKLMAFANFNPVIVETVGMGQLGWDATYFSGLTLTLMSPGMGDDIQFMKSGILDLTDALIFNKSDIAGADKAQAMLQGETQHRNLDFFVASAKGGIGIENIANYCINKLSENSKAFGEIDINHLSRLESETIKLVERKLSPLVIDFIRKSESFSSPEAAANEFLKSIALSN